MAQCLDTPPPPTANQNNPRKKGKQSSQKEDEDDGDGTPIDEQKKEDDDDGEDTPIDERKPAAIQKKGSVMEGGGIGDDDDINCIRANEDNDNDSDFDYANMSELDVSDDEVSPIHLSGRRRNKGGPRVPVKGTVSDEAYKEALKLRKQFNDKQRYEKVKAAGSTVSAVNVVFTGVCDDHLRPMSVVKEHRLQKGQTFPNKDILWLRIAEEANLRHKHVMVYRSDIFNLIVYGERFFVGSTFVQDIGWKVNIAAIREGDDGLNCATDDLLRKMDITVKQRRLKQQDKQGTTSTTVRNPRTPYHMRWVADIIKPFVLDNPDYSYLEIKNLLKLYANDYAITHALIQDSKALAKDDLFGSPEQNARYANGVVSELAAMGHHCEVMYGNRKDVNRRLGFLVLAEESVRRKVKGEPQLQGNERNAFLSGWKEKNAIAIETAIGLEDGPQYQFLTGICFSPSTSVHTVGYLQKVVQADAAHMKIGKYTLFSAYAASANGNMAPLAFAILFGNEDTQNWRTFWEFTKRVSNYVN